jgi:hypothetical protein
LYRGWPDTGASRLRHARFGRGEQFHELVDGFTRAATDAFAALAPERMLEHEERKPGDAERADLAQREALKDGRGDDAGGRARLRQLDGVVETPRRARPSVG